MSACRRSKLDSAVEIPKVIAQVVSIIENMPKEVAKCKVNYEVAWTRDTVYYDKTLVGYVQEAVDELGNSNQRINSGAGHDAQFASYMLPTTMVFVPSKDGHSHCEPEFTSTKQCTMGASVLLNAFWSAIKKINTNEYKFFRKICKKKPCGMEKIICDSILLSHMEKQNKNYK